MIVQFGIVRPDFNDFAWLNAARFSVWLVFLYILVLGYVRLVHPQVFFSDKSKQLQVVLDTLFFSGLYFLSRQAQSDLFLLYLVPLLIASDYLGFIANVLVFGLVLVTFTLSSYAITMAFAPRPEHFILQVIGPRLVFLGLFELGFWALRRLSTVLSLDHDRGHLLRAAGRLSAEPYLVGNNYRLLWVSPRLQSRHGENFSEKTCFAYFAGRVGPCPGCPIGLVPAASLPRRDSVTVTARDVSGTEYQAEIRVSSIPNVAGVRVAAVLRDISALNRYDRELEAYANLVDGLADAKVEGLAEQTRKISARLSFFEETNWLDILHELSLFLAGHEPLNSIMRRALELVQQRLQAETAAIFLWEAGKLRRKAIIGIPDDWFSEESYGSGEGLTGQAIHPLRQQRYGQPVLRNNVDESPDVLWPHVVRYREALPSHEVKHLIAVPLNDRERSFGVLRVVNRLEGGKPSVDGFTQQDVDLLGIMATQIAMAIDNRRLHEAERKRRELAERLVAASIAVTSSLQLDHVLEQILDQLRAVIPYDSASVQILEADGFHIVACRGFDDPEAVKRLVFPLQPDFPNTRVLQRKEAYIVDNVQDEYRHFRDSSWHSDHIRSWLGVPMCYHDNVVGMIALDSKTPGFYRPEHAGTALGFATQAAIALAHARLFEGTSRQARQRGQIVEVARQLLSLSSTQPDRIEELREKQPKTGPFHKTSATLSEILATFWRAFRPKSVKKKPESGKAAEPQYLRTLTQSLAIYVVKSVVSMTENAEGAVFHRLDSPTGKLWPVASWSLDRTVTGKSPMSLGQGIAGIALQTRQTINVPDTTLDPRYEATDGGQLRSLLAIPLYAGDKKLIGTLSVYSSQTHAFDETDADLLTMLGSLAGVVWATNELWQARGERRKQMEQLLEAARKFEIDIELQALCKRIVQVACDVLNWKAAALKIFDAQGKNFKVCALVPDTGPEALSVQGATYPVANIQDMLAGATRLGHCSWVRGAYDRMRGRAIQEQYPFFGQDNSLEWKAGDGLLLRLETLEQGRIGLLVLADPGRKVRPSTDEIQLIEFLGSQATVAIAQAFLYQQTKAQRDRLQDERNRLESELHEAMNALATGVRWEVEATRQAFLEGRSSDVQYGLNRINTSARRTYQDLRFILGDLRKPILEREGLIPAIRDYVSVAGGMGKVTITAAEIGRLPFDVEHTLYRIAQEAISNALKHAQVRETPDGRVRVKVSRDQDIVDLEVIDNGCGFDVDQDRGQKGPSGLTRMYEWAETGGVALYIGSAPGKGTIISARARIEEVQQT